MSQFNVRSRPDFCRICGFPWIEVLGEDGQLVISMCSSTMAPGLWQFYIEGQASEENPRVLRGEPGGREGLPDTHVQRGKGSTPG